MKIKNVHYLFETLKSYGYKASGGRFSFDVRQLPDFDKTRIFMDFPPSFVIDFLYEMSEIECPKKDSTPVIPEIYNKIFPNCEWYRIESTNRKINKMLIPSAFFQDMRDKLDFILK